MTVFWDVGALRPDMSPLPGDAHADLCIVGLGGSALTAAVEAARRGMNVVAVDADRIAAGAAGRNGGFMLAGIAMFHHDAVARFGRGVAAAMYQRTLEEMARVERDQPNVFRRCGVLRAAVDDAEFQDCVAHRDALVADGFAGDLHSGAQGRGLLIPTDGVFHPVRRAVLLADQAMRAGARLHTATRVTSVEPGAVHTEHGTVTARHILVALDGGLARVLPVLHDQVRDVRLQMVATAPTEARLPMPVYARHGYDYWQQHADGSVTIGGGRDVAGASEDTSDSSPTSVVRDYLERTLRDLGVHSPVTHHWAATVGYTDCGLPVVTEALPGVWAIGGYCGTGNIVGALLARGIVELLDSGASGAIADFQAARA